MGPHLRFLEEYAQKAYRSLPLINFYKHSCLSEKLLKLKMAKSGFGRDNTLNNSVERKLKACSRRAHTKRFFQ